MLTRYRENDLVLLNDCPPGLFLYEGHFGLLTEYGGEPPYVAASGEAFWGGTHTKAERGRLMVQPIDSDDLEEAWKLRVLRPYVESLEQESARLRKALETIFRSITLVYPYYELARAALSPVRDAQEPKEGIDGK